jgi:type II secretory pathway pseudopilin PulG
MAFHFKLAPKHVLSYGFTVVELMVTVTIVVLVTAIIMIQYASFNNSVLLRNQAYLTAFDIREAQALAVSVKGRGGEFREEYGIYFTYDGATPDSYILFQDNESNGDHSPARYHTTEAVGQPYRVDPRFLIKNLCATNSSSRTCTQDDPKTTDETVDPNLNNISLSFKRPDFDAQFYSPAKSGIQSIDIQLGTPSGSVVRTVTVYQTGQVSVH